MMLSGWELCSVDCFSDFFGGVSVVPLVGVVVFVVVLVAGCSAAVQ